MEKLPVIFLGVPKTLSFFPGGKKGASSAFKLDPSIHIPLELESADEQAKAGSGQEAAGDLLDNISAEKIISGMLRVISAPLEFDIPPEWADYYKSFVLTVKPEIYHEFTAASIVKAKNGEFDMALEISAVLEGLFPGSQGILLNKALILEKRARALEKTGGNAAKENAETLEAYERVLAGEPVLPDALFNAGFFFTRLGEYKRAKDCFSGYVSKGSEPETLSEIPFELPEEKLKQAKKIIADINSQALDDSDFIEAYNNVNTGNDEEALSGIRDFLQKHPKAWNGWFVLGWALRKLGRFADSLEALKKAAELGGKSSDLRNETAICLMELGELKAAQKELEKALRENPTDIKIISNMGVLAMKAGDREKAASYFRYILELDPNDPLAKSFLGES